jgi:hypothetical protein
LRTVKCDQTLPTPKENKRKTHIVLEAYLPSPLQEFEGDQRPIGPNQMRLAGRLAAIPISPQPQHRQSPDEQKTKVFIFLHRA